MFDSCSVRQATCDFLSFGALGGGLPSYSTLGILAAVPNTGDQANKVGIPQAKCAVETAQTEETSIQRNLASSS